MEYQSVILSDVKKRNRESFRTWAVIIIIVFAIEGLKEPESIHNEVVMAIVMIMIVQDKLLKLQKCYMLSEKRMGCPILFSLHICYNRFRTFIA